MQRLDQHDMKAAFSISLADLRVHSNIICDEMK